MYYDPVCTVGTKVCICVLVVPLTLSCVVDAVKFFNDTGRVVFGSVLWCDGPCESEVYGSRIAHCRCEVVQGYHDMTFLVVSTRTLLTSILQCHERVLLCVDFNVWWQEEAVVKV